MQLTVLDSIIEAIYTSLSIVVVAIVSPPFVVPSMLVMLVIVCIPYHEGDVMKLRCCGIVKGGTDHGPVKVVCLVGAEVFFLPKIPTGCISHFPQSKSSLPRGSLNVYTVSPTDFARSSSQ